MANTTRNIWNDDDGERVEKKKRRPFRHFLIFFLVLTGVLGVVIFAAYRDGTGFDALQRYLSYGSAETVGGKEIYHYDASGCNRFAVMGNRLAVLSDTHLCLFDQSGEEIWSTACNMSEPAISQGGDRVVAYDIGGTELYVLGPKGEILQLKADEEERFLAATLNRSGMLAVTSEKRGYKGCVTVYDRDMEMMFVFDSSDRFVMDAYVTDDDETLAAVTLGQENGLFVSNVVLYDLTVPGEVEPVGDYDITDGLVVAVGQQGDRLATVSDTCLTLAEVDGSVAGTYDYGDSYLRGYDLGGSDFAVLLLNRYQSGSVGRLVSVDTDGTELASLQVNREVLDISAADRYLAVLYTDSLVIYNRELEVYSSLNGTDFASGVLMREDGAAVLLSGDYAGLFLP